MFIFITPFTTQSSYIDARSKTTQIYPSLSTSKPPSAASTTTTTKMSSGFSLTNFVENQKSTSSRSVARPSPNEKTAELLRLARRRARVAAKTREQNRVQNFLHDINLSFRQMFTKSSDSHRLDSKKKIVLKSVSSTTCSSFHNSRGARGPRSRV